MHGGRGPVGPASPAWRTGRYSKVIPARLAETYQRALSDGDLLVLRDDIALMDSRIGELLGRVDTGESGSAWRAVREAYERLETALVEKDMVAAQAALGDLDKISQVGMEDGAIWDEVGQALDRRERLVRSERRRMVELQQMITAEQATAMLAAVISIVREHVTDRDALRAISESMAQLANRPGDLAGS